MPAFYLVSLLIGNFVCVAFFSFLFFNLRFQHSKEKQNYSTYPIILSMLRNRILASVEKNIYFLLVCPKLECNKTQTFQQRRGGGTPQ